MPIPVCEVLHTSKKMTGRPPRQPITIAGSVRSAISRNISGLSRHSRGRRISVSATSVAAFGPLAGLSISLIRAKAKDAVGSSRSLYIRRYRCGDLITSMEMASIIALPICDMRRDLRISATSAAVKGARRYGATHGASIAIRISTSTSTNPMPACRGRHETPALGRALRRENDRPKLRRVTRSLHAYLARARSRSLDHFVGEHGWQDFEAERFGGLEVDETLVF